MSVPPGLKSSPSRVMQRVDTSRANASFLAVPASCGAGKGRARTGWMCWQVQLEATTGTPQVAACWRVDLQAYTIMP